jgi:hypothetical protein
LHSASPEKNTGTVINTNYPENTQNVRQSAHEEANPRGSSSQSARNEEARPSTSPQHSFDSRPDNSSQDASSQSTCSQSTRRQSTCKSSSG